jgi:catechol 2,3-dioxygenase-like lactoylglutathione lyase family enzyme
MRVRGFDHVSLPTRDVETCIAFYKKLGFPILYEDEWRAGNSRLIGIQVDEHSKINVHVPELWQNPTFKLKGPTASPGCGDLCFYFPGTIEEAQAYLQEAGCEIEFGPVEQRGGGKGGMRRGTSIYTRDPDDNLLEFMTYKED